MRYSATIEDIVCNQLLDEYVLASAPSPELLTDFEQVVGNVRDLHQRNCLRQREGRITIIAKYFTELSRRQRSEQRAHEKQSGKRLGPADQGLPAQGTEKTKPTNLTTVRPFTTVTKRQSYEHFELDADVLKQNFDLMLEEFIEMQLSVRGSLAGLYAQRLMIPRALF